MKVYFYHTQNVQQVLPDYEQGRFPGHLLYGATSLAKHGIKVVWHRSLVSTSRFRQIVHAAIEVLRHYREFDAIYASRSQGLDFIVLLRALRLFPKPIVIWHHQPISKASSVWRELAARCFYRGYDELFFFSEKLINDSLRSVKARRERMHLGHWGPDLHFYDTILQEQVERRGFVSTGKELRDMTTLVEAFNRTGAPVDIYLGRQTGGVNYEELFEHCEKKDNVEVHFVEGLIPYELSKVVHRHQCVVICCQQTNYTVGLTTLVEALALGMPVISSRNPQYPFDIEKEGCGIAVDYYDVDGWVSAIRYITTHPAEAAQMGQRGRRLAERLYNMEQCAAEVAAVLRKYKG